MKKSIFLFNLLSILIFSQSALAYQTLSDEDFALATGKNQNNANEEVQQKNQGGGLSGHKGGGTSLKSNQMKLVTWASPENSGTARLGLSKEYTRIYQTITTNHNNNVEVEEKGNGTFSLKANSEEDWEAVGGEKGSPLAFWLDSDTSLDDIKSDPDSFYKSRYLEYTMVCENLSCDIDSKPSYLEAKNGHFDGKKCVFDFSYTKDSPEGEEFEIKVKQKYRCQMLMNDQYRDKKLIIVKDRDLASDIIGAKVSDYKDYFIQTTSDGDKKNSTAYGFVSEYINKEEKFSYVLKVPHLDLKEKSKDETISESNVQNKNLLLESLFVDENQLKPNFNSNYFYYQVEMDKIATNSPSIIASAYDSNNEVTIDSPEDLNSNDREERIAYINVISPDQKSRKTYAIAFSYKKQKNYLLDLSSNLGELNPQFSKYKNNYQVDLSKRKELFIDNQVIVEILKSIKATSENSSDKITIMPVDFKPEKSLTVSVSLVSSDKLKSNQYYITFFAQERMWYF
jgi:hypothetical protein